MADYYVNGSTGDNGNAGTSSGAAWETISYAVSYSSLAAGDTIHVAGGTYPERVLINSKSGTAMNPINLVSEDGEGQAIIDGGYTLPSGTYKPGTDSTFNKYPSGTYTGLGYVYDALLQFDGVVGWDVDGFVVQESRGRGITINNSDNITLSNMTVNGCRNAGVWVKGDDNVLEDSEVTDCGNYAPVSRAPSQADWPVTVNFQGGSGFTVQRCAIHHNWGEGIAGRNGSQYYIHDNFVYDNYALNIYAHLNSDTEIFRNVVWHSLGNDMNRSGNPSWDIVCNMESQNFAGIEPADNFRIRNNLIITRSEGISFWNNQGGGLTSGYIDFLENTVIAYGDGVPFDSITNGNTHSNTIIRGNIFYSTTGGDVFKGTVPQNNFHFSHNLWSSSPPSAMAGTGDIIGNPSLQNLIINITEGSTLSPANYKKAQGSLGIGTGTNDADLNADPTTTGETTDFFGVSRGSSPDMGFDQFSAASSGSETTFYVSTSGDNSDGLTEATAWDECDQIDWDEVTAGDTIVLVGPDTFTTTLQPTKSGTATDPIFIRTNGELVYIRGSRGTDLLPEAGETVGVSAETHTENGIYGDESYIDIDGGDWNGIIIEGWQGHGIYLKKDSSDWKIRNVEVRNNGYVEMKTTWTGGGITYSGSSAAYPNGAGIRWGGARHKFERVISHDNGQDAVQSEDGDDNAISNGRFSECWFYNARKHTIVNGRPVGGANTESFNYASHADGIQIYSGGEVSNITIEDCIFGPGCTNGLILGQTGVGGATELITSNQSFETDTTGWTYAESGDGYLTRNSNTHAAGGTYSARINMSVSGDGVFYRNDDISITNSVEYTLTFWVNTQQSGKTLYVYLYDGSSGFGSHYGLNGASFALDQYGWAEKSVVFTANATVADARLGFDVSDFTSGDTLRLDDISIVGSGSANTTVPNLTMTNVLVTGNQDNGILGYPSVENDNWTLTNLTIHGQNTKQHAIQLEGENVAITNCIIDGNDTGADINFVTTDEPTTVSNNYQKDANDTDIIGTVVDSDEDLFADVDADDTFALNDYTVVNSNVANAGCSGSIQKILGVDGITGPNSYGSYTFTTTDDLIRNGTFEDPADYLTSWEFVDTGAGTSASTTGANSTTTAFSATIGGTNNSQLRQSDLSVIKDTEYKLTFWAKSSAGRNMAVRLFLQESPYTNYGLNITANLSTTWAKNEVYFTATETSNAGRLQFRFNEHGQSGDTYYIDEVSIVPVTETTLTTSDSDGIAIGTTIGVGIGVN